jgi:HD-like signal output (HDOD) protein
MTNSNLTELYKTVLDKALSDKVKLPSVPDIAMKVRQAIADPNATTDKVTQIIAKDPALTAYLVRAASSPVYRRAVQPKTLTEVITLLGFAATNSLVVLHSTQTLVSIKNNDAKKLFNHTWERLVIKTSVASFIAQQLKYRPVDQVQMAMLLTEVGSLLVLSTMLETAEKPDTDIYFQMCRQYSKQIGAAVLTKWDVDKTILDVLKDCGHWSETESDKLILLDIANLSLYYTVLLTTEKPTLPSLESLAAYKKIPESLRGCSKPNWLDLIANNDDEIKNIISSFK